MGVERGNGPSAQRAPQGMRLCRKASHAACVRLRTPNFVSAFF